MNKTLATVAFLGALGLGAVTINGCGGGTTPMVALPACDDTLKALDLGAGATVPFLRHQER